MVDLELLRKYWSVLLVAVLLCFFGYRALPEKDDQRLKEPGVLGQSAEQVARDVPIANERLAPLPQVEPSQAANGAEQEFELREFLIAVPSEEAAPSPPHMYTQDSPEVKAALSKIKIEIYGAAEADDAAAAKAFLSHNELSFSEHDTKDVMERERARRLAGNGEQTVIVIDGQVVRDRSHEGIQGALLEATKKRVLEENEQSRLPEQDSTLP